MAGFIFGGNTGIKAGDLAARREALSDKEAIAKMLAGKLNRRPQNLGEGIGYLGNSVVAALAMRKLQADRKALAEETSKGRGEAWSKVMSALTGGGAVAGGAETPPPAAGGGDGMMPDTPPTGGKGYTPSATAGKVFKDLVGMGYPEHIAAGLVGNIIQESGHDINTAAVGDGGAAYGMVQWNGPRKAAYLKWASENGVDPASVDAQVRYLDHEMKTTERGAYDAIMAAKTPEEAARIASEKFWRPGTPMMDNRLKYTAGVMGAYGSPAEAATGGGTSTSPVDTAGGMSPRVAALIEAAGSEYLTDAQRQVVNALLAQEMAKGQPMDPYKAAQLEMDRKRLAMERERANREYGLDRDKLAFEREKAEAAGADAPDTIKRKLQDGSEVTMQWDSTKRAWVPLEAPAGASAPDVPGKYTESEARVVRFKSMQEEVAPVLDEIETIWDPANIPDALARQSPIAPNWFQSEPGQMYEAAASQWVEGALRLATGAAATPPEFERTMGAYFARVGDTPATIEFKRRMRAAYTRTLEKSLGSKGEVKPGTLELPEDFRKRYMKDNPPPEGMTTGTDAASDVPAMPQEAIDEGISPEVWKNLTPEQRKLWE